MSTRTRKPLDVETLKKAAAQVSSRRIWGTNSEFGEAFNRGILAAARHLRRLATEEKRRRKA